MEEHVGQRIPDDVGPGLHLAVRLVLAHADADRLLLTGVDGVLAHGLEPGLELLDAVPEGGQVLLDGGVVGGLGPRGAGHNLAHRVGEDVDLPVEGEHVWVDAGRRDAGRHGAGLDLGEDGEEGVAGALGLADGGLVEAEAGHGEERRVG